MFMSSKRNLARENEELKAQIAALTGKEPAPRQAWGLGLEHGKNQLDQDRFDLERAQLDEKKYRFEARAARAYASQVVQALLILNGVGALAVLAFIAGFSKDANFKSLLAGLFDPLSFFCYGAVFAVLTGIFAFLGQGAGAENNALWCNTLRIFAMVLALGSLLLFVGGLSHAAALLTGFHV